MVLIATWEVSITVLVLICVGALLLILLVLALIIWACCCCCRAGRRRNGEVTKVSTDVVVVHAPPGWGPQGPGQHRQLPPGALPAAAAGAAAVAGGAYGAGHRGAPLLAPPKAPPSPVTGARQGAEQAVPSSPGAWVPPSPGQVKKWEEELRSTLFRKMSLDEVKVATGQFSRSNMVGEGAFAVVYRGKSPTGVPWAVKRSKQQLQEGSAGAQDFENEVIGISRLSHKHLARLLGYCVEGGEHILVYEYAPNGSLSSALFFQRPSLNFTQRLEIAIGTAEALYYLHTASSPPIIHRDVKPDNIFLGSDYQAKLGDFGLLKKLMENPSAMDEEDGDPDSLGTRQDSTGSRNRQANQSVYTRIAGTPGYLDPEYHLTSKVTTKGDVYSFGVVLMQLCTGQRAILPQHPQFNTDSNYTPTSKSSGASGSASGAGRSSAAAAGTSTMPGTGSGSTPTPPSQDSAPPSGASSVQTGSGAVGPRGSGSGPGTSTAFAGLGGAAAAAGGMGGGEVPLPGEPIHVSHWVAPYVQVKVVEPIADTHFGNNYNKTALFRMLEIGLMCTHPSARKRPTMSNVVRWLHEVQEEMEKALDEPEGQYSSLFPFDREAMEAAWAAERASEASNSSSGVGAGSTVSQGRASNEPRGSGSGKGEAVIDIDRR